MLRFLTVSLAALGGVVALSESSRADVYVRAPFVRVYSGPTFYPAGPGFSMRIPFVLRLDVNQPPRVLAPPVIVSQPPPPLTVQSPPPPVVIAPMPAKVPTHEEFASAFKPLPGTHDAVMLHPGTNQSVNVTFTLPEGTPKVHILRRAVIFDYGRHEVELRFALGGGVKVLTR